jgi:type IV secretion system protein VirB6
MSVCEQFTANASAGVAPALRAVDCLSNEATAAAFGRLFGGQGALLPALTVLLTLYIAFFAISLLTGRSRIGISALTPRMITLGLVLTFSTSWVAYQGVVWTLATGAPDQIAGVLMGAKGSATTMFADRIDMIFGAIAEVGQTAGSAEGAASSAASGSFTPVNLMWLAALLLMLGTVGVLLTARIALAMLLALGPVFVVLALFPGTRGLTAGWLRGLVLTAITPLFVVLGGGLMIELIVPVVAGLANGQGGVDGRAALALFLIASVHVALMAMVMKVAGTIVAGWQVFGLGAPERSAGVDRAAGASGLVPIAEYRMESPQQSAAAPRRAIAITQSSMEAAQATPAPSASRTTTIRNQLAAPQALSSALPPLRDGGRARGIGSRFRTSASGPREMMR